MNTILRHVLELTVMIPGMHLAYLPVQTYLKQSPGRLAAWLAPLLAGICLLEGGFCYFFNIPTSSVLFPTLLVLMLIYHKSLNISIWKSGSIFLGKVEDRDALIFLETIEDKEYATYIYEDKGYLKELFTQKEKEPKKSQGESILEVTDFTIQEASKGLFRFTAADRQKHSLSLLIHVQSE